MLTLHVRSRVFPQLEDAAQFIKAIIGMYDVFMENKRIKAAQAVANLVEVDSTAAAAAVAAEAAAMEADVQVRLVLLHCKFMLLVLLVVSLRLLCSVIICMKLRSTPVMHTVYPLTHLLGRLTDLIMLHAGTDSC